MKSILYIIPHALSHRTAEENLGVGYIASFLRERGYRVGIIDAWLSKMTFEELIHEIDEFVKTQEQMLFIGVSTYVSNIGFVRRIVAYIKKKYTIPIVAGGFGPSFFQKDFLDIGVDIILIGEGEICNLELCDYYEGRIDRDDICGIAYMKNGKVVYTQKGKLIENLDELPFPARDTMSHVVSRKSSVNILSARGCFGHCNFCSVIAFQKLRDGKIWRERSIQNIVDEIELLYNKGVNFFKMIDDSFIEFPRDEVWCRKFAEELKKRGIKAKFRGSLIADFVTDNIVSALKDAGFFSFACGVENFAQTALDRFGKRASTEDNCSALEVFYKYHIRVQCGLILFDPYTTIEELKENLFYLKKYYWVITKGIFTELYAAVGTTFTNKLLLDDDTGEFKIKNENYIYTIKDTSVKKIYFALKRWHQMHQYTYDMVIDPLIAPKNISDASANTLYHLYLRIHEVDLCIFERSICLVELGREEEVFSCVECECKRWKPFYTEIEKEAENIYLREGMIFDGDINKYISN